jgi:hypothetical protein
VFNCVSNCGSAGFLLKGRWRELAPARRSTGSGYGARGTGHGARNQPKVMDA